MNDLGVIKIQRVFRGFLCRCLFAENERQLLIRQLREWAQGCTKKLVRNPELQNLQAQGTLHVAITIASMPSRPYRRLPTLTKIRAYRNGIRNLKDDLDKKHNSVKYEYSKRSRERAMMGKEDQFAYFMRKYDASLRLIVEQDEREKRERIKRERNEEILRRHRAIAKNLSSSVATEKLMEQMEREDMFREEYNARRYLAITQAATMKRLNVEWELMTQEDRLVHSIMAQEKKEKKWLEVLTQEIVAVRDSKLAGDNEVGQGGKRLGRSILQRRQRKQANETSQANSWWRDGEIPAVRQHLVEWGATEVDVELPVVAQHIREYRASVRVQVQSKNGVPYSSSSSASGSASLPTTAAHIRTKEKEKLLWMRAKYAIDHRNIDRKSKLEQLRSLRQQRISSLRKLCTDVSLFQRAHIRLVRLREIFHKDKLKTRLERQAILQEAVDLEASLPILRQAIITVCTTILSDCPIEMRAFVDLFLLPTGDPSLDTHLRPSAVDNLDTAIEEVIAESSKPKKASSQRSSARVKPAPVNLLKLQQQFSGSGKEGSAPSSNRKSTITTKKETNKGGLVKKRRETLSTVSEASSPSATSSPLAISVDSSKSSLPNNTITGKKSFSTNKVSSPTAKIAASEAVVDYWAIVRESIADFPSPAPPPQGSTSYDGHPARKIKPPPALDPHADAQKRQKELESSRRQYFQARRGKAKKDDKSNQQNSNSGNESKKHDTGSHVDVEEKKTLDVPGLTLFLEDSSSGFDFIIYALEVRGWLRTVGRWIEQRETEWKARCRLLCISFIQRFTWMKSFIESDVRRKTASKFHIRCSDENNLVSVEVLAKLEKCSALDLYELLLCRSDIVFQAYDPVTSLECKHVLHSSECDKTLGRHPASLAGLVLLHQSRVDGTGSAEATPNVNLSLVRNSGVVRLLRATVVSFPAYKQLTSVNSFLVQALQEESRQLKELTMRVLLSGCVTATAPYVDVEGRLRPSAPMIWFNGIHAADFIRIQKDIEAWDVDIPGWMQPAFRWGTEAGPEPFWRRLLYEQRLGIEGKYTKLNKLDDRVDRAAKTFYKILRCNAVRRKFIIRDVWEAHRLRTDREMMGWEDALAVANRQEFRRKEEDRIRRQRKAKYGILAGVLDSCASRRGAKVAIAQATAAEEWHKEVVVKAPPRQRMHGSQSYRVDTLMYDRQNREKLEVMYKFYQQHIHKSRRMHSWVTGEPVFFNAKGEHVHAGHMEDEHGNAVKNARLFNHCDEAWVCGGLSETVAICRVVPNPEVDPRGSGLVGILTVHHSASAAAMNSRSMSMSRQPVQVAKDARTGYLCSQALCNNGGRCKFFADYISKSGRTLSENAFKRLKVEVPHEEICRVTELQNFFWKEFLENRYSHVDVIVRIQCWARGCVVRKRLQRAAPE